MATNETQVRFSQSDDDYDGPLLPFADFMNVLGEHHGVVSGAVDQETGVRMTVLELAFDLPMELRVRESEAGGLDLRSGPPTQRIETTVFPVLHRLEVRLALVEDVIGTDQQSTDEGIRDGTQAVE